MVGAAVVGSAHASGHRIRRLEYFLHSCESIAQVESVFRSTSASEGSR